MNEHDLLSEQVERAALEALHRAAGGPLRRRLGLHLEEIGGALVSISSADPGILLNRTIGLGVGATASRAALGRIAALYRDRGVGRYYLHLHPAADPPALRRWLLEEGFEPARGWMKFRRGREPAPLSRSRLVARLVGVDRARDFGRIVAGGFAMEPGSAELLASLAGRQAWRLFLAFDGPTPAAAAALFLQGRTAWLDWAATLPPFRGRGAQSLLLRTRVEEALAAGCDVMFTETGEAVDGDPQHSYRNILRAGFATDLRRENFVPA